jgi:DNA (cytosine-5)-methyltransferase 1
MWSEAVRALREIHPKAFIFENVKGLTRQSFANYFGYILLQLNYPGVKKRDNETWEDHWQRLQQHHYGRPADTEEYRVTFKVLNAANFGVPQKRARVVFVGFRADVQPNWSFPKESHSQDALLWSMCKTEDYWDRHRIPHRHRSLDAKFYARGMSILDKPKEKPWVTTRDAIGDLPDPERRPREGAFVGNHRFQPGARSYPGHTGSPLDEPAKTLKAGVHGVPGGENMLVREDGSIRYFSVRESARLQTFPDNFIFHGAWSEATRQLGNAVPVLLAQKIAKSVATALRSS